jgi:glycosyltransferase involved in cell wall biosynthesis
MLGRLDSALLPGLIASAEAVVVPSLHEGFGLPVLEAMAAGTAVVAADTSSLPEVAGGAALLVPPTSPGIAEGLMAVLGGDVDVNAMAERGRRRAAEFTWERCAAEHAAVWNDIAD